jgi:hypothetical protein
MKDQPAATGSIATEEARGQALHDRVLQLHDRTIALRAYAIQVAERARATRAESGVACNHAAEVEQIQHALSEVEAELAGLKTAMRTRAVIEQAKGMLMAQRHVDADEAFQVLVGLSQTTHRKLVEVAAALVENWKAPEHGAP